MRVPRLRRSPIAETDLSPEARHLLVHRELMTVRMEQHYGQVMRIDVLVCARHGDEQYERETLLIGTRDGVARQVAHILVNLAEAGAARSDVLEGAIPFGTILTTHNIRVIQHDLSLFAATPSPELQMCLGSSRAVLHGRHYTLRTATGGILASVTEILP